MNSTPEKKNKQKKNWACPQPQELPENESLVDSIQIQGVLKPATDLPIFLETSSLIWLFLDMWAHHYEHS